MLLFFLKKKNYALEEKKPARIIKITGNILHCD